ncbi:hypothetical protein WICPIJ_001044 [Wickerhamomyces pijperi]|uniref:Uncharacterized protein n=1 Tax=Wickerhamomyces pijperi TaxID=599730 RepID=A0A9P8QCD3_WICPI|nr:hypothetical protein WICPIJ_001044 [Wickerhamomyces pijperi]
MVTTLSLDPEANCKPSPRYSKPHTSPTWLANVFTMCCFTLTSLTKTSPLLQPVATKLSNQLCTPTLVPDCVSMVLTRSQLSMSQISTLPDSFPMDKCVESSDHLTEVIGSLKECNKSTDPLEAFQM